jgi:C1A family cysteine protease
MFRKSMLLISAALLLLSVTVYADTDEHSYINAAIHAKGGKWVAGETSVSKLSQEERDMRVRLHKPTAADGPVLTTTETPVTLSTSLDWRSYNNNNYVTPVRNQGSCGSCWAFATTASLESSTNIKNNTPGYDLNLAEQIMVSCGGAGSCSGGSVGSASNYIRDTGLPLDSYYPYTATNGTCPVSTTWRLSAYRVNSWFYVATSSPTVDGIKNALAAYGPLVTTMAVYNDFFSYRSGVYAYATGSLAGYHAIQIVGYDDTAQCFIVKNSWGTGWGELGFFRIAYSELNSVTQFGDYTIAYVNSTPTPPPDPTPVACSFTISPTSATFQAAGGTGSITVTASRSDCTWLVSAASNQAWITVTDAGSGVGSDIVSYGVDVNTSTVARTGTIAVAGQTITVTEKAPAKPKGKK